MRLLYAPDSFTGFCSAREAADVAVARWRGLGLRARACPMADGGVGTLDVLRAATGGAVSVVEGVGPRLQPIRARVLQRPEGAFVESAEWLGLHLCGDAPPPSRTSVGLGRWLAAQRGPVTVGLGGSGTMDGGLGLAQGLGLRALDANGAPLPPGAPLGAVAAVVGEPPPLQVRAWADVSVGLAEAAPRFGPQKGATPAQIVQNAADLQRWAAVVNRWRTGRGRPPVDPAGFGCGAAGGLGFGLRALADAPLSPGAEATADAVGLAEALSDADVVITGEGRVDPASFAGKVVGCVTARARAAGAARVLVLVGARTGALPPPPTGPDAVVTCDDQPGADRAARYVAAVDAVAALVRSGRR
ncbi:MAG: glycerate kinase [Alphaproteobacteria bacterium]|nr:glycerate kinase [Alphaproteobacteria bacterium]